MGDNKLIEKIEALLDCVIFQREVFPHDELPFTSDDLKRLAAALKLAMKGLEHYADREYWVCRNHERCDGKQSDCANDAYMAYDNGYLVADNTLSAIAKTFEQK